MPKVIPNPIKIAKKYNFILDEPINLENAVHPGECECKTKNYVTYNTLRRGFFCRNKKCKFYQTVKKLYSEEMKLIVEERGCKHISITGTGIESQITFICICGFEQTCTWRRFHEKSNEWCFNYNCKNKKKVRVWTVELLKKLIEFEGYSVTEEFNYEKFEDKKAEMIYKKIFCPQKHLLECSIQMWINGARCNICVGNNRSLSLNDLKQFYTDKNCVCLLTDEDYLKNKGNHTVNIVPYRCSNNHIITNLTKNDFNNRINQNLGACVECERNIFFKNNGVTHHMQLPKYIENKKLTSNNHKKYTLPSGKIVILEGSEDACLNILLQKYNENEITFEESKKPRVSYVNPITGKKGIYFPDFYIEKENLIIESKSIYWYKRKRTQNDAKTRACVELNYNVEVWLFDEANNFQGMITYKAGCTSMFDLFEKKIKKQIPSNSEESSKNTSSDNES